MRWRVSPAFSMLALSLTVGGGGGGGGGAGFEGRGFRVWGVLIALLQGFCRLSGSWGCKAQGTCRGLVASRSPEREGLGFSGPQGAVQRWESGMPGPFPLRGPGNLAPLIALTPPVSNSMNPDRNIRRTTKDLLESM